MKHHKIRIGRIFLVIVILSILAILIIPKPESKKPDMQTGKTPDFSIQNINLTSSGFNPKIITIRKGDVVIWTNKSGGEASVNSVYYPSHKLFPDLNLGAFKNGSSVQTRIYRTGELRYVNHLNPSQTGTIVVLE